jgi:hypothetical protein
MPHEETSRQTRRCTVVRTRLGWAVEEEEDSRVIRRSTYTDWHRVELALAIFDLQSQAPSQSTKR